MNTRIMKIFYGADNLPYKDQERQVHYPIVGNAFMGASNTTEVRFYFRDIGNEHATYVANTKLPNGRIGSKLLDVLYDTELQEWYAKLLLTSFYTQINGDVYISLQGYQGGVVVEEEDGQYTIVGTPTIQATGSVKINIAYATDLNNGGEELDTPTLQELLALIGTKANQTAFEILSAQVNCVIEITTTSGTLTQEQFNKINQIPSFIVYANSVYTIVRSTTSSLIFRNIKSQTITTTPNKIEIDNIEISVSKSSREYSINYDIVSTYTEQSIDNLLSTIKQNAFKVVSELPSEGEAGIVYLVAINPSDLSLGYMQYIWETNQYISLGSTSVNLADYYTKEETNDLLDTKGGLSEDNTWTGNNTFNGNLKVVVPSLVENASVVPFGYIFSNFENLGNKTTILNNNSTDSQYPTAKAVYDKLQIVKNIAMGRTKTLVIKSSITSVPTAFYFYDMDKVQHPISEFDDYVNGYVLGNSKFNTQNDAITFGGSEAAIQKTYYILMSYDGLSFEDITGSSFIVAKSDNLWNYLNTGDIILVKETNLPDRWVYRGAAFTAYKQETFNTADYVSKSEDNAINWNNTFNGEISFMGEIYTSNILPRANNTYSIGEYLNGYIAIYVQTIRCHDGALPLGTTQLYDKITTVSNNASASDTVISWHSTKKFTKSADTTFTFESPATTASGEYSAIITNGGSSDINLTFTGITNILCNDDNITINSNVITLPSCVSIEINMFNNCMVVINWGAN